jgi:hypothetical protein
MLERRSRLVVLLLFFSLGAKSQKVVTDQQLVWYGYFLSIQFNDKWHLQTEVQERHFINPVAQHQFLIRSDIHRALGASGWETSAGMCAFFQNPNDPNAAVNLTVPELRPHIEFAYRQKVKIMTFDHRYRAEARFFHRTNIARTDLEDGFEFGNFRLRYRLQATVPVWRIDDKRTLKVKVNDEVLLNAGSKIIKNVFDQNRIYAGISFDAMPKLTFDAGYLNWYQQRPTGDFYNRNILRFSVYHKITL